MVTFLSATVRATPARKAVSPARAPDDRSRPASGIFTEPDVMLTMRPNLRWHIGSITFWISSIGHHHVGDDAVEHLLAGQLAEIAHRRAGIVVDQDVGLRAGGEQRLLAFGSRDIGDDRDDLGAGTLREFGGSGLQLLGVAPVDHHLAAGFRQCARAGLAEPAARCADDGLAAGNSEIHGSLICA